jgi:hypothetical protein
VTEIALTSPLMLLIDSSPSMPSTVTSPDIDCVEMLVPAGAETM